MTTISYHTWKARQQIARLVLLCAIGLSILPTVALSTTKAADTRPVLLTAASVASLSPQAEQPASLSHFTVLVQ